MRAPLSASMCSLVCLCVGPLFAYACPLVCLGVRPLLASACPLASMALCAPLHACLCIYAPFSATVCSLVCLCMLPFLPLIAYPDYCLPFPHPFLLLVLHFLPTCMPKCVSCVHAQAHHSFFICVPTLPQLVLSVCPFVLCSL